MLKVRGASSSDRVLDSQTTGSIVPATARLCQRGRPLSETTEWVIPEIARPKPEECAFDLDRALSSVLSLRAEIPPDAFTASILGTERAGNGVVIDESGLVVTIGYLITEAETLWLSANEGAVVPGHVVGYDQASGFGLVQALGRLGVPALELGSATQAAVGDAVVVAGGGGRPRALSARIVSKREFAGYWEYVLDEALFTMPPHPSWGGPADRAGVRPGDIVLEVAGQRVTELATTFRRIWSLGPAGTDIPLTIAREGSAKRIVIHSADRNDFLKKPRLH